jgi:hypothetical protein
MRRIGLTIVALLSALALSACGSSSSGGGDDTDTQPASSANPGDFDKTAAQQQAEAAVLTLDDLPDGWTSTPADESDSDDAEVQGRLADCIGVDASIFAESGPDKAEAKSDEFASPNNGATGNFSEDVTVESDERVTKDFEVVNSEKLTGCLETVFGTFLKEKFVEDPRTKDAEIGDVSAERSDLPAYGDESVGVEVTVPFSIAGTDAKVVIDMVFIRVGNAVAQLSFENTFAPFDSATAATIMEKATEKLSQAAA